MNLNSFNLIYFGAFAVLITSELQAEPRIIIQSNPSMAPYRLLWTANDQLLVTKSRRGELRVWHKDGTLLQSLAPLDHTDSNIAASADGRYLAGSRQGKAIVMDRLKEAVIWQSKTADTVSLDALEPPMVTVATSAVVQRINFQTGEVAAEWKPRIDEAIKQVASLTAGLAVFLHNRSSVVLDKQLVETQRIQHARPGQYYSGAAGGGSMALSTFDGAYLVTPAAGERLWRPISSNPTFSTAVSTDGAFMAASSPAIPLALYATSNPKEPRHIEGVREVNALAWSSDSKKLAVATNQQGVVICDAQNGQIVNQFGASTGMEPLEVSDKVSMTRDASVITMVKDPGFIMCVSLKDGGVQQHEFDQAVQPPTRPKSEAGNDILLLDPFWIRLQRDGRLIGRLKAPSSSVFDSGYCGDSAMYVRANSTVRIFSLNSEGSAETGSFPLGVTLRCVFTMDGSVAIHEESTGAELVIREAPSWKVVAKIAKASGQQAVAAITRQKNSDAYTWLDDRGGIYRYEVKTAKLAELRAPGTVDCPHFRPCVVPADWFITQVPFSNPINFAIYATKDGTLLHQQKQWSAFTDEIDLEVIGISKNRRGLWLCGHAGRPILVDLESGQPVLRLHTFGPGEYLWETPNGQIGGSSKVLAEKRCFFLSPDGMSAKPDAQPLKWRATLAEELLKGFN
ncbi:MAG: hypothetical protein IPK22_10305 [Verrucomicrobiaceae bacterium]|nr:hypothetical protein [Verrucomicrobiaceae bacterium]